MSDAAAEQKIRAARGRAAFLRSYFDHALYAHVLVESKECPTVSVDRYRRLYYSPDFVHSLTVEELVPCLLHEIGHSLRGHLDRARSLGITNATMAIANTAMDAELNDDLRQEIAARKDMPHLPSFAIYPERFGAEEGKVWEMYYQHLMSNAQVLIISSKSLPGSGDAPNGEQNAQGDNGQGGPGRGRIIVHDCGSGAHGVQRPWEEGEPGVESKIEGVADADWEEIKQITAEQIAVRHRGRGDVPGGWLSWANTILRPRRIPWDHELSAGLRWAVTDSAGMVLHTYKRPGRRSSALPDFVMPHMRKPQPFVCIIGDASGSMNEKHDLALVRGVAEDVCLAMGARVAFLSTDTQVHGGVQNVISGRHIKIKGRGGTNMCAGIEYAMTHLRPRPDVLVIVTDCDTPWPVHPPRGVRVIVCAVDDNEALIAAIPKWARVIRVDPDNTSASASAR